MTGDATEERPSNRAELATDLATDLALGGLVLAIRFALPRPLLDDAYIVLAVARNALTPAGPHLDPGSGDAVLSTLLWPALLAIATHAGLPAVVALRALGLAAELALALVVRRLGAEVSGSPAAGVFVAAALATHPLLLLPSLGGMETALVLALLAGAALALARGRALTAGLLAGLLPWARVDGALAAAVLLAALARRGPTARRAVVAGAALAAAAPLAHRFVFGLWLPATVTAKAAIATSGYGTGVLALATEFARALAGMSAYWLVEPTVHLSLLPLALLGAIALVRRPPPRAVVALSTWALLYVAAFVVSGRDYARNFPWYFTPPVLVATLLAAPGVAALARRVPERARRRGGRWRWLLPAIVGLAAWPALGRGLERVATSFTAHRERAYAAAAIWLGRHGPAASIASNEIGALAWYSPAGTAVVDLLGLSRSPHERGLDAAAMLARRRPEAIVGRADFRLPVTVGEALPGAYVWLRAGALDIGLVPRLADRMRPRSAELERIYRELGRDAAFGDVGR